MMRLQTVLLSAALLLPFSAAAQTTNYTYTGVDFNSLTTSGGESQVFTSSDLITVEFTTSAPLADNLNFVLMTPASFSISDGLQTFTNLTAQYSQFDITTNASGVITQWTIYAGTEVAGAFYQAFTTSTGGPPDDEGLYDYYLSNLVYYYAEGTDTTAVGTWTVSTPESSSPLYAMLSAAALACGFILRKRLTPPLDSATPMAA